MSGFLWVQLLSPEAASAFPCQRNDGPLAQSHIVTRFNSELMAGLLMRTLFPIITLWLPPSLQSKDFKRTHLASLRQLLRGQFCSSSHGWWPLVESNTTLSVSHRRVVAPAPQSTLLIFSLCSLFSISSSRSRRSTLCSRALWWTCSLSSIRALKSSASWSVPTLRLLATTWRDSPRWLSPPHALTECVCLSAHLNVTPFFLVDYRQRPAVLRWHHSQGLSKSCQERESGRWLSLSFLFHALSIMYQSFGTTR